jgi:hypothetical protein
MDTKPPPAPPEPPHARRARLHALLFHGLALGPALAMALVDGKLPPHKGE